MFSLILRTDSWTADPWTSVLGPAKSKTSTSVEFCPRIADGTPNGKPDLNMSMESYGSIGVERMSGLDGSKYSLVDVCLQRYPPVKILRCDIASLTRCPLRLDRVLVVLPQKQEGNHERFP